MNRASKAIGIGKKLAVLAILGVVAHLAARIAMEVGTRAVANVGQGGDGSKTISTGHTVASSFIPWRGGIDVQCRVEIMDIRPDMPYFWSLELRDPGGEETFSRRDYPHQVFYAPTPEKIVVDFSERVEVPPGRYMVIAQVNRLPTLIGKFVPGDLTGVHIEGLVGGTEIVEIPE